MKAIEKFLLGSLLFFLAGGAHAKDRAPQEAPPAQNPGTAPSADAPQSPSRGGERRMGLFGKLTAVHDQSMEITTQKGDVVTVKISGTTRSEEHTSELQ